MAFIYLFVIFYLFIQNFPLVMYLFINIFINTARQMFGIFKTFVIFLKIF